MNKKLLFKNTIILIICSLFIKVLALTNRIVLTRLLGEEGIGLYIIILPSIMLFLSLGSFSLNTGITQMIAKSHDFGIIKKAIKIACIASTVVGVFVLFLNKILTYKLLRQPNAYYPILFSIPLIYLSAFNSILRGYYNGLKKVNISSISILIEQISRIILSILLLIKFKDEGISKAVSISIIAMSFGELFSIIYIAFKIKKIKPLNCYKSKDIVEVCLPITTSRLFGNITFFLEPIIFTFALGILKYNNNEIMLLYGEVNAYAIPLITMFLFIPTAISQAIIPDVASQSTSELKNLISSTIFYSLLPAIPLTIILTLYSSEYMQLIYGSKIGANLVSKYAIFFVTLYIQPTLISIMQATNRNKKLLVISCINDILRLLLIFTLPMFLKEGLIISFVISSLFINIYLYLYLKKTYKFKLGNTRTINLLLITIILSVFSLILKIGQINYLISSFLLVLVFLLTLIYLGIIRLHNK